MTELEKMVFNTVCVLITVATSVYAAGGSAVAVVVAALVAAATTACLLLLGPGSDVGVRWTRD